MKIRVSAVQYHLHTINSFEEFAARCDHYVRLAQEFGTEFLLFPEFFTTQLLSIPDESGRARKISRLPEFTEQYRELFFLLARNSGMHIIAGTHVLERDGKLQNTAHLFYPEGRIAEQPKLHITPTEVTEWNIAPGAGVNVFDT
ncbi:MAG: acyltransferase, partial [Candidatus Hydrogenedentes bacterium]|nr:acyltransferase [Candidatus Hydrogenedentota bacterium]